MCSNSDRVRRRSISNTRSSKHPYAILSPTFQFIQKKWCAVQKSYNSIWIGTTSLNDLKFVVDDTSIALIGRWWLPRHSDWSRPLGHTRHILRRGSRDCIPPKLFNIKYGNNRMGMDSIPNFYIHKHKLKIK